MRHAMLLGSLLLLAVATVCLVGCNGVAKLDLTSGGRDMWQRPTEVIAALDLSPGDAVADLGAGEGYFVEHLSGAVGDEGRVYAIEVDSARVEALRARFPAETSNVTAVLGAYDDPKLPAHGVDLVLLVNTYHHIEDRPAYFARLQSALRPGGRVVVIEPDEELGGVLSLALDEGHTSVASEVESEMRAAGYAVVARPDVLPVQIFRVFAPESVEP